MVSSSRFKIIFILLSCFFPFITTDSFAGLAKNEVTVYKGTTPVLDGYISPGEYDDASSFAGMKDWTPLYGKTSLDSDLSIIVWVKHDGINLYFAFDVTDNLLYGIDIDRWLPVSNTKAHDLTREGYPWFGDGLELLINASNIWDVKASVASGTTSCWQMVCSSHKSRLGGLGIGGLMEGEPRSVETAWNNYQSWILSGAMQAAVRIKTPVEGHGYFIEWMIKPNPCLEVIAGKYWNPEMGEVKMGMNIGVQDFDNRADGAGWENIRHEDWWASYNLRPIAPSGWGTMILVPETKNSTFIDSEKEIGIKEFNLHQNYPNPFNPYTTIDFDISKPLNAKIEIYNLNGQLVKTLCDDYLNAGNHSIVWNGTNNFGVIVSAGLYFYKLKTDEYIVTKKMLFLK